MTLDQAMRELEKFDYILEHVGNQYYCRVKKQSSEWPTVAKRGDTLQAAICLALVAVEEDGPPN